MGTMKVYESRLFAVGLKGLKVFVGDVEGF